MDQSTFSFISDLRAREPFSEFTTVAVLARVEKLLSPKAGEYLRLEFADRTGRFSATVFSSHRQYTELSRASTGTPWIIAGKVDTYQGTFSPSLVSLDQVPDHAVADFSDRLQAPSPVPYEELRASFAELLSSIGDVSVRMALTDVFDQIPAFATSPAALGMHHAHRHGLLAHTVNMARVAKSLMAFYPRLNLNPDVVLAGILLHDAGKVFEYDQRLGASVTPEMLLSGHIASGYALWTAAAKKANVPGALAAQIGHVILSHHGARDFGSPVEPHTAEAWLVHCVDLLDARMAGVEQLLAEEPDTVIVGRRGGNGQIVRTALL